MTDYVVIRLRTDDDVVQWMLVDNQGTRKSNVSSGPLEQAGRESQDRPVIVLVPAIDVLTTSVRIPARSVSRVRAALPFALEENVADDVENLHFASGTRRDGDRISVAVVARQKMHAWLERLDAAGIEAVKLIAENAGLAKVPGTMSLLIDGGLTMFNDGADLECVLPGVKPADVLVATGKLGDEAADDEAESAHLLAFCDQESSTALEHDWNALRHELNSVDVNVLPDGALPKLAVTVASGAGVNLLQGAFGRAPEYAALLRPWKTAAALFAGLMLLAFVAKGVDYYRLSQEKSALQEQFSSEYRQIRPGDTREILDPVNTVASLRRGAGSASAPPVFLQSLQALSAAVKVNTEAEIEAISYRAGVIDIRLSAPDVPTLDEIQRRIAESGQFQASIESADQVGDGIDGRIQIREGGS